MTERVQRFFAVQAEQDSELGPRQVRLRASTEALGRDGLVVVTRGIDLGPYQTNPVMLFEHDPKMPVARALDVSIDNDALIVLAEFAPEGVSAKADEVCGLVKSGIVSGISCGLGFNSADTERVDPKNRAAGTRLLRSELREISFCGVPADKNSLVLERTDDDDAEAQAEPAVDTVDTVDTSSHRRARRGEVLCRLKSEDGRNDGSSRRCERVPHAR
jgi:HK97 family phage prohead protease